MFHLFHFGLPKSKLVYHFANKENIMTRLRINRITSLKRVLGLMTLTTKYFMKSKT